MLGLDLGHNQELYGQMPLERMMRKHVTPCWLGLLFLVLLGYFLPLLMQEVAAEWPTNRIFTVVTWLLLACLVSQVRPLHASLRMSLGRVGRAILEAGLLSLLGSIAAVQMWPVEAKWGVLDVAARAIGDGLVYATIWPFLVVSLAYTIAPSRKLVEAEHPVQYRDRENTSKVLVGVAGLVLVYKIASLVL